jgi:hypothetical protein
VWSISLCWFFSFYGARRGKKCPVLSCILILAFMNRTERSSHKILYFFDNLLKGRWIEEDKVKNRRMLSWIESVNINETLQVKERTGVLFCQIMFPLKIFFSEWKITSQKCRLDAEPHKFEVTKDVFSEYHLKTRRLHVEHLKEFLADWKGLRNLH